MENIIKQLKRAAKDTRLSSVEKATIKSQLLNYVHTHPVIVNSGISSIHPIPSPFNINNLRNKKTLSTFVIGGLLLGSSVSFASENTVPGDILYPIKIHVNERVLGAMAISPDAKAVWEINLAERRLEEVEKLAVSSTVSQEIKTIAEENFKASTRNVENRIATFEKSNDGENAVMAAGKLADMLRKHEVSLAENNSRDGRAVNKSSIVISTKTNHTATSSEDSEQSVTTTAKLDDAQINNILENVRGARGNAEKKQNELKDKYFKKSDSKEDEYVGHVDKITDTPETFLRQDRKNELNKDFDITSETDRIYDKND